MEKRDEGMPAGCAAILLGIFVVFFVASISVPLWTQDRVTFTVTEKERVSDGESSYYLVYTDGETFKNSDILALGKFDSSDVYGRIEIGEKYRATVCGWRVPWLSWHRNIVSMAKE